MNVRRRTDLGSYPRNYPTMDDYRFGTPLVHLDTRNMKKLSHKDLIIALGVLVAAVIVITSVYFKDTTDARNSMRAPEKKVKPAAIINTVLQKLSAHTSL